MAPNPESTKQQLIAAAEQLFASRGVEGVSLREINTAAGQKNSTALQYHFVDRRGLVHAVLAKHTPDIDLARHALLDEYERNHSIGESNDLRALAAALVRPSAAKLADLDGGREYLQINAQVLNRPELRFDESGADSAANGLSESVNRWRRLVGPLLPDVAVRRLHHRFTAIRVSSTELARRASGTPRRDDQLFTSHLIDLVAALLAAPVSEQTAALLRARGQEHR